MALLFIEKSPVTFFSPLVRESDAISYCFFWTRRYIWMTHFIDDASLKIPRWFSIDAVAQPPGGHKEKLKRPKQTQLLTAVRISCVWLSALVFVYLKLKSPTENRLTTKLVTVTIFNSKIYDFIISCYVSLNFIIIIILVVQNWEKQHEQHFANEH